jgi:uncharacterized protein (TIGR02996 family)
MPPRDQPLNPPIPALHPERDALLAAVRDADPADDLPALVYADWQDEHDQPEHAELIRVMVEMGKNRGRNPEAKARRPMLLARMKELFKTSALKPLRKLESDTWKFSRGFVRDMTFWLVDRRTPRLRGGHEVTPSELADLPAVAPFDKLAWLGLMLPKVPTTEHAAAIAAVPWLSRIDRLEQFRWNSEWIRPGTLAPLAASKNLGGLRTFTTYWLIAASELASLYLAKSATGLREFPLRAAQWAVTSDTSAKPSRKAFLAAIEQILSSKRAKQFTSFGDETVDVDEALAKVLLASPHLKNVREFRFLFKSVRPKTQAEFVNRFGNEIR